MKQLFWKAAKAYNVADYEEALAQMEEVSPQAVDDFKKCNPKVFCRAFLRTNTKCDVIVSNMAETFNCYIINARAKHLIFMLEDIRTALMQRLVTKREEMEKSSVVICPRVRARLEKEKEEAAKCEPIPSSSVEFQVSYYLDSLVVNLEHRTCSCRRWDLTGIPCRHAIACMFYKREHVEQYVQFCYTRVAYLEMYAGSIPPLNGERFWPNVEMPLDPPPIKVGPGRPRRNRRKAPFEDPKKPGKLTKHGVEMSCSICKSKQHNKRRCPDKGKVVEPPPKRRRGRPSKGPANQATEQRETPLAPSTEHHSVIAQPTRLGKHGRVIKNRGGNSARGGGRGGRGGRGGGASSSKSRATVARPSSSKGVHTVSRPSSSRGVCNIQVNLDQYELQTTTDFEYPILTQQSVHSPTS